MISHHLFICISCSSRVVRQKQLLIISETFMKLIKKCINISQSVIKIYEAKLLRGLLVNGCLQILVYTVFY